MADEASAWLEMVADAQRDFERRERLLSCGGLLGAVELWQRDFAAREEGLACELGLLGEAGWWLVGLL